MSAQFLNAPGDVQWLKEVHARAHAGEVIGSFVITGNGDCPESVELYRSIEPTVDEAPFAVLHPLACRSCRARSSPSDDEGCDESELG